MSKRKFKPGEPVKSLDDFMKHEWFIVNGKTYHRGWVLSWQLGTAQRYVERGMAYVAQPLTNGEFYAGKTDEQIQDMIGEDLCELYCPLPEEVRGVHCYGGEPVMCEGAHCAEAIEAWKEEGVE